MFAKIKVLVLCSALAVQCSNQMDSLVKPNATYTGAKLLHVGTKYNKPLLRLIGKILMEIECRNHPCGEWSAWSPCTPVIGQFGVQTRFRNCGIANDVCTTNSTETRDQETQICDDGGNVTVANFCPEHYEIIDGEYCLKYHNITKVSHGEAEATCKKDSGFLVNINSRRKLDHVNLLLDKYKQTGGIHIDGVRKDTSSPWEYSYEKDLGQFTNWGNSQPDDYASYLCLGLYKYTEGRGNFDRPCSEKSYFVCQIVQSE